MTSKLRVLDYGDGPSSGWTWFKVFLMTPPWGLLAIPVFATIASKGGDLVFQAGHLVVIVTCILYFINDLKKRQIKVTDDYIEFGFRHFNLAALQSIGMHYKDQEVLPKSVDFDFSGGKKLKLHIGRLKWEQFESLLRFVESRSADTKIDPVLLTVMKCKKAAGKSLVEIRDSVTIPYESRRSFRELAQCAVTTADEWGKSGPILLSILATPCWLAVLTGLYLMPRAAERIEFAHMSCNKVLGDFCSGFYQMLGSGITHAGSTFWTTVSNPVATTLFILILAPLFWWLLLQIWKPNSIYLDSKQMRLTFNLGQLSLPLADLRLAELESASLFKPTNLLGPEHWKVRLRRQGTTVPIDLDLAGLAPQDKQRLLKGLETWAPHVVIDPELSESLLPRQERSYTELWLQSLTQAPERRSLEPLEPGRMLSESRYEVVRRLGIGGQGTAYLCKDTGLVMDRLSTAVVLKETIFPIFVESAVRQQALERFEREAVLLKKFESENIVRLLDYFIEDHRGYLVMEHVDGMNLRQLVQAEGPLPASRVRELLRQMCDVLSLLHDNGVIHRDFTPDNIILSKAGQIKLIDFNVAQVSEEGSAGTIVGKHAYLPPEQFRGKPTKGSDIYALGSTVFYLLTGEDPEPISQSIVSEKIPECDQVLDELVRRCTELQESKRFKSAQEVGRYLEGELEDKTDPGVTLVVPSGRQYDPLPSESSREERKLHPLQSVSEDETETTATLTSNKEILEVADG